MWAVHFRAPNRDILTLDGALLHEYLVLSMSDATMVLKSGETLAEVTEQCEFVKTATTLTVGNLFDAARIAQVHAGGVRMLAGEAMAQDVPLSELLPVAEPGARVLRATVLDPYILLHVTPRDRQVCTRVRHLQALERCQTLETAQNRTLSGFERSRVLPFPACLVVEPPPSDRSVCRDTNRIQVLLVGDPEARTVARAAGNFGDGGDHATAGALYADDVPAADHPWSSPEQRKPGWLHRALRVEYPGSGSNRRMLALCRKGGDLELFTLPELKRVFHCAGAHRGLPVLEDGGVAPEAEPAAAGSAYPQVLMPSIMRPYAWDARGRTGKITCVLPCSCNPI